MGATTGIAWTNRTWNGIELEEFSIPGVPATA
jgi:hypothetical protein